MSSHLVKQDTSDESEDSIYKAKSMCIITYGMGVHWAIQAQKQLGNCIDIIDLRTLNPIDYDCIYEAVETHGKCLILTEEPRNNSMAQALCGNIQEHCFEHLDAPVITVGSMDLPCIPINTELEKEYLPSVDGLVEKLQWLLEY